MSTLDIGNLEFGPDGLLPAVIRDASSGAILTLAYVNEASLRLTLETGEIHFWSRSRNELWHKGETSGNRQRLVRMRPDCDGDALLIDVDPLGPACHSGQHSCFGPAEEPGLDLRELISLLRQRKVSSPEDSYSASLFRRGVGTMARKVGEEATEVVIAAMGESRQRLVEESADLLFHLLVLMVEKEITLGDVARELHQRRSSSPSSTGGPLFDA